MSRDIHPAIPKLKRQLSEGRLDRREFLRTSTLLGLSATAAYAFVGKVTGQPFIQPARAQAAPGGTLRIAMRVKEVATPHTFAWAEQSNITRQVCQYLSRTGHDNVTRAAPPGALGGQRRSADLDPASAPGRQMAQRPRFRGGRRDLELPSMSWMPKPGLR